MKLRLFLFTVLAVWGMSACSSDKRYTMRDDFSHVNTAPMCMQETTVEFYDDEGMMELPACEEYDEAALDEYIEVLNERAEQELQQAETQVVATEEPIEENEQASGEPEPEVIPEPVLPPEPEEDFSQPEGDFPQVYNNKYDKTEVVLENLNTRVLVFCRGTEFEVENCVRRLEGSCYRRINDIPHMSAKYDKLRRGVYPGRRWHEGELVPRW